VTYKRWDVVAVTFPFIEGTEAKKRPALIVSTEALHGKHRVYWTMMITTAKAGVRSDDIRIAKAAAAGLPEDCVIRPSRLATLGEAQIDRRIGAVSTAEREAVTAALRRYIG
jgi:mRNA-degrading endonuclease toxin of MazEF toxin-antitoxin module